MSYTKIERRLNSGGIVILDGGTGTELERRGVPMHPDAWSGPATLDNVDVLENIHRDYFAAGADIVIANTYASSRLMLGPAGFGDSFEEINKTAIHVALRAREASGQNDALVAGCLSHMCPIVRGTAKQDRSQTPSVEEMTDAFEELATLFLDEGCDLIILEMMFYPERIPLLCKAAIATGLPVWAGFSARQGKDGQILGFAPENDIPFSEVLQAADGLDVAAAGVMHTPSNIISDAIPILREAFAVPLMAYPDSGYFKMPNWHFENVMRPEDLLRFSTQWVEEGAQIVGGCCGLSPEHITALEPLKAQNSL